MTEDAGQQYGPDDVAAGDYVLTRWGWTQVVRVNRKTISVLSLIGRTWTDRLAWHDIRKVHKPTTGNTETAR